MDMIASSPLLEKVDKKDQTLPTCLNGMHFALLPKSLVNYH